MGYINIDDKRTRVYFQNGMENTAKEAQTSAERMDGLAQLHVPALDDVGRVDDPADALRERKEWRDMLPGSPPGLNHRQVLLPPGAGLEGL